MLAEVVAAATIVNVGELATDNDVLFLFRNGTDYRDHSLILPFRTGLAIESFPDEIADPTQRYDLLVVDGHEIAAAWRDGIARLLRPHGHVAVVLPVAPAASEEPDDPTSDWASELTWVGTGVLGERVCAVLAVVPPQDPATARLTATLLTTVHSIFTLGADTFRSPCPERDASLASAREALTRQAINSRASERALLGHLEVLVKQIDAERRKHRGLQLVRTILKRHRAGRGALRVLGPAWRLLRRRSIRRPAAKN